MANVKEAEERKNQILDVAEKLFAQKGFDHTSTVDILKEVGIARGTLYYHFSSKEDILDAVIQRITGQLMSAAEEIAGNQSIPVLERLTKSIIALNVNSSIGQEIMTQVHKPQNALLHQKMREQLLKGVVPIITKLAEEGIRQGIFQTDYPAQAVEMLMLYSSEAFDDIIIQSEEEKMQRIMGFIYNAERILGMKQGTLQETIMAIFRQT